MRVKERQRLFLAFPLSQPLQQGIRRFRNDNAHLQQPGFRWIPEQNLHITVFYLGPVLLRDIGKIGEQTQAVLVSKAAMTLLFQAFTLQPLRKPRMIWAQFCPDQGFVDLVHGVADVCKPYLLEQSKHHSQLIPHVTVARMRQSSDLVSLNTNITLPSVKAQQAQLWSSEPTPKGAIYTPLATFALGKTGSF